MTTWLVLRTSGFLVLGLLTVAVSLGVAGPAVRDPGRRLVTISVHRAAAVLGTGLLLLHVTMAVLDSVVTISWPAVFIPGLSSWQPLWIGLGALAFDAVLMLAITSALRRRFAQLWWNVHVVSYVAYALAWAHAVGAGSDASSGLLLVLAGCSVAAVGAATAVRLAHPRARVGVGLQPRAIPAEVLR